MVLKGFAEKRSLRSLMLERVCGKAVTVVTVASATVTAFIEKRSLLKPLIGVSISDHSDRFSLLLPTQRKSASFSDPAHAGSGFKEKRSLWSLRADRP